MGARRCKRARGEHVVCCSSKRDNTLATISHFGLSPCYTNAPHQKILWKSYVINHVKRWLAKSTVRTCGRGWHSGHPKLESREVGHDASAGVGGLHLLAPRGTHRPRPSALRLRPAGGPWGARGARGSPGVFPEESPAGPGGPRGVPAGPGGGGNHIKNSHFDVAPSGRFVTSPG